jgi:hypothetical protein
MKKLIYVLLLTNISFRAQEKSANGIALSYGYGFEYNNQMGKPSEDEIGNGIYFYSDKLGSFSNLEMDYLISKERHLGLGFSRSLHKSTLNQQQNLYFENMVLVLEQFENRHQIDRFDFHFGQKFNKLDVSFGIFYFIETRNEMESFYNEEHDTLYYKIYSNKNKRADNIGLFTSLTYAFPITENLNFGLHGKWHVIIGQVGIFSLSPTLTYKY